MKMALAALLLSVVSFAQPPDGRQTAKMVDAFEQSRCDDVKSRLDNAAVEVHKDPTAKLYVIFYGGRDGMRGLLPKREEAKAYTSWWKLYVTKTRDLDDSRVEVIDGGFRPEFTVELWIVPSGAKPPTLKPTLTEKDIRFRRGKPNCKELFGENSECGCVGY